MCKERPVCAGKSGGVCTEGMGCLWPALFPSGHQRESENNRVPDQWSLHPHLMEGFQKVPVNLLK